MIMEKDIRSNKNFSVNKNELTSRPKFVPEIKSKTNNPKKVVITTNFISSRNDS